MKSVFGGNVGTKRQLTYEVEKLDLAYPHYIKRHLKKRLPQLING